MRRHPVLTAVLVLLGLVMAVLGLCVFAIVALYAEERG
jgi:hypothetical protein